LEVPHCNYPDGFVIAALIYQTPLVARIAPTCAPLCPYFLDNGLLPKTIKRNIRENERNIRE
jgi:hypothetical protein